MEVKPPLEWGLPTISSDSYDVPNALAICDKECGVPHFLCENIDVSYLQEDIDYESKLIICNEY